ncbi:MAG: GNAT family N-acetyltransferase [Candidatus Muirbacterium halophilum]|nr:GNAT family N-acetyltransferase [Candidatus Muirbacterium halophilum]MCK9475341.1 GNAT family N-acetyltransferase [Candidatus Muirbacterium halophilum]
MHNNITFEFIVVEDFDFNFDFMKIDFPEYELMDLLHFKKLIFEGNYKGIKFFYNKNFVAYCFYYITADKKFLWLDYFAVLSEFRNMGIGSKILLFIKENFNVNGVFLELEIPKFDDDFCKRRIEFYERNNAIKLNIDYNFKTKGNDYISMFIYYIPFEDLIPDLVDTENIMSECLSKIHSDIF